MLHACFYTIYLVFRYTSWCFYAISGTNLLTRWHSASSLFSDVFVFQKSYIGNILGIGRNKSQIFYFSLKHHEVRRWDRGRPGARLTLGWRGLPLACATRGWGQLAHLLMLPFRLYIPLDGKNLRDRSLFLKTYCKPPPLLLRDREDPGALLGTLPDAFSSTMVTSGVMCE
jgi:hypothetical protein